MAYQSLREVCATSGEYIKREIVVLLSTFSPSMTNGHAVSVTQRKRVLISHCSQQLLSNMTTACGHKINLPSCITRRQVCLEKLEGFKAALKRNKVQLSKVSSSKEPLLILTKT